MNYKIQVNNQVWYKVKNSVRTKVWNKIWNEVQIKLYDKVSNQLCTTATILDYQMYNQVQDKVQDKALQLFNYIKSQIQEYFNEL